VVTPARASEVQVVVEHFTRWAHRHADVRGLALVGSWARGTAGEQSDVDLVALTDAPTSRVDLADWPAEVGPARVVGTVDRGAVTECRLALASGLEVDLGVGSPAWAGLDPVDPGTRRVVSDGMRILYDPDGLLAGLAAAC
jgi:hypothetical protein